MDANPDIEVVSEDFIYAFSSKEEPFSFGTGKPNSIDEKINMYAEKLPILEDDTKNIIEYNEPSNNKKKKKFNFWKLLESNE